MNAFGAGTGSVEGRAAGALKRALAAVDSSAFWLASAAVFAANAVLALVQGEGFLALLAAVTGILAGVAALLVAGRSQDGDPGEAADVDRGTAPGTSERATPGAIDPRRPG